MRTRTTVGVVAALSVALTSGCALGGKSDGGSSSSGSAGASGGDKTVTLVTHESWAVDKSVLADFTKQTGYTVKVQASGDAGALANKLVLSKDNPTGDVVFGIDNSFASRVAKAGVFEDYTSSKAPASAKDYELPEGQGRGQLSPIDHSNVCVNVDDAWFTKKKIAKPTSFEDLTKAQYKNLMVAPGAATSSPGMSFFLATVAQYGKDGWKGYWQKLMSNGLKLTSGWSDAWNVDYTGNAKSHGDRPIIVSYDTSPADTLGKDGKTTTSSMSSTCFGSVEYAGVLKGAKNEAGAKAFVDFMNGETFQKQLPDSMYVFPVDSGVALPKAWAQNVTSPKKPLSLSPADIDANRESWLTAWKDVTSK